MSVCNFTQMVSPETCLGDSLATFNANFSALDEGLCSVPDVTPGLGIEVITEISEQIHTYSRVSTKNNFVYDTNFEYKTGSAASETIFLSDGTSIPVTTLPYVSGQSSIAPLAIFSTISLTDAPPKVTLFWTASGSDNVTVYNTNVSLNENREPMGFNGPVTSLLSSENILYVGGEFTTVGGIDCKKFCAIDLTAGGGSGTLLGATGELINNPFGISGDLGVEGTVHAITQYENLLIIGGSFQSIAKGRGLCAIDKVTGNVYPFYVNGTVHDLLVVGTDLYVGGVFDYVNYAAQSASVISGLRVDTNGLLKVSLETLVTFPNSSIDKAFAKNISTLFTGAVEINAFAARGETIYIGGSFDIEVNSFSVARNLAILNLTGTHYSSWKPIVGGKVLTLAIDGDYLYVGGSFNSFHTSSQFYSTPRVLDVTTKAANAICFNIEASISPQFEYNWKPMFDGPVTKFAFQDNTFNSYVYCYGRFTRVNNSTVSYIAVVEKSYNNYKVGKEQIWRVQLQSGPELINQNLVRYGNSVIIGGTFTEVNGTHRYYLTRVSGFEETLESVALSSVELDMGAQLCSPGMRLNMHFTDYVTVSSFPGVYGTVNQTIFSPSPEAFSGYLGGDLIKFFVRRPKNVGTFKDSIYVLGWKVDFNG
jgi:hypothetical protein